MKYLLFRYLCFGLVAFADFGFLNYKSEQKVGS